MRMRGQNAPGVVRVPSSVYTQDTTRFESVQAAPTPGVAPSTKSRQGAGLAFRFGGDQA